MKIKNFINLITIIITSIGIYQSYPYIPTYLIFILIFTITLSFFYEVKNRLIINIISIIAIIYYFKNFSINTLVYSGINSIIFLISVKFIEKKKYRDYMQIYVLILLLISGTALLSINIKFLISLALVIYLCTISAIFLIYYEKDEKIYLSKNEIISIFLTGSILTLSSIPLAFLLFIILPRVNTPILDFLNHSTQSISGFTNIIKIGELSEIQKNKSVVFRVKMKKIYKNFLYWPGVYLTFFNGRSWEKPINNEKIKYINEYKPLIKYQQEIFLEPYNSNYLFALDHPKVFFVEKKFKKVINSRKISKRIKYFAISEISSAYKSKEKNLKRYLQLPKLNNKILNLAKKLGSVEKIYKYLTSKNFQYSLKNLPVSQHPLNDFLFKYKKGNCEYFATAFAILSRIIGVPSRLVAGYVGGEYNNLGKYYIIRESNAHTWVEIYKKGLWLRIDPTIGNYSFSNRTNIIKNLFDLVNYYWFIFVINYGFDTQLQIAFKIEKSLYKIKYDKKEIIHFIIITFFIFSSLILLVYYRKNLEDRLLKSFLKKMKKYGYNKKKSEGLLEFSEKIKEKDLKEKAIKFSILYYKIFFGEKKDKKNLKNIRNILKRI